MKSISANALQNLPVRNEGPKVHGGLHLESGSSESHIRIDGG